MPRPSRTTDTPVATEPTAFASFAIAAPGVAPLVAAELSALGVPIADVSAAGVAFSADYPTLLRVNLWSRLATRVIVRLAEFTARDFATLEKQAERVPWRRVLTAGSRVRLRVTCRKSRLYHSDAVAERVARSMVKMMPKVTLLDRAIGEDEDDLVAVAGSTDMMEQLIIVRFEHDVCTISADSSGELLHRRGWRHAVAKAPLRETLAATMLAACEWTGTTPLVDPFCGSGTIGIEAALLARNIAPGLARRFAMEQWIGVDARMVEQQRADARAAIRSAADVRIVMSDRDAGACDAARANAARAGVTADVEISQQSLSDVALSPLGTSGLVLTNPPYGLRISEGLDLRSLYARLGEVVRAGGPGWQLGMLVPDKRLAAQTSLRFETRLKTSNGGIGVAVERSLAPTRVRAQSSARGGARTPERA